MYIVLLELDKVVSVVFHEMEKLLPQRHWEAVQKLL